MSIAEKLVTIAENEQKVYDAGKKAKYDAFWDVYQKNGNRSNYDHAFFDYWDDTTYNPKYPIVVTSTSSYIYAASNITSTKVPITIDTATAYYLFYACGALKTIPSIKVTSKVSSLSDWFALCSELEEIYFTDDSEIANNVSFSACEKLTHASLLSIIGALKDYSGTTETRTCTFGSTNLAKLTDAEKKVATDKGWTLA